MIELNGATPGTGHDQLNVRGTNNLGSSSLGVSVSGSFSPVEGQPLVIINNDGSDPITGTFSGLPQGSVLSAGNYRFVVSYNGGSGNDVTLTLTNQVLRPGAALVFSGNGNGAIEANECNLLSLVVSNVSGSAMIGASATLRSLTPGIAVIQPFSGYPDIPAGQRRTNNVPFQVSAMPGFVCGSDVNLELQVATTTHGTLKVPLTLPSGVAGNPTRFNVSISTNIPDLGAIESTNMVAGFSGPLLKVAVSLWLTHTWDADLNLSLISPDGVVVDLSSGNGAGGNFGSACSPDTSRTTFDDAAATAITAGVPPYVGVFRPEGSLASLVHKTANGNWRLRVQDTAGGTLGALRCWSLFLYGVDCTPAGGACELCPDVTIYAATGPNSLMQTGYIAPNNLPSVCGVAKTCPGSTSSGPYPTENFVFRNGPTAACITVTLEHTNASFGMVVAAHSSGFNPANTNRCATYLADPGLIVWSNSGPVPFSFNVAPNAGFVINVLAGNYGPYKLTVAGGDCRPVLNITPAGPGQMKLDWSTSAAGYQLECTDCFFPGMSGIWPCIDSEPIVVSGRFTVTNAVPPTNSFFHLRKPPLL